MKTRLAGINVKDAEVANRIPSAAGGMFQAKGDTAGDVTRSAARVVRTRERFKKARRLSTRGKRLIQTS